MRILKSRNQVSRECLIVAFVAPPRHVFYLQTALVAHVRNPVLSSAFHDEDG
jgi:hypothetical protein